MKFISCLLVASILNPMPAFAQSILHFQARISDERLAEEAIELLHCISSVAEVPWELSEEQGKNRLVLQEQQGKLRGELSLFGEKKEIEVSLGEAQSQCEQLFPKPRSLDTTTLLEKTEAPKSKKTWVTLGAILLAAGVGFFLWKQNRHDYGAIQMSP